MSRSSVRNDSRRSLLLLLIAFPSLVSAKSKVDGDWAGSLEGDRFPLVFHIRIGGASTTDSPRQKVFGMPVVATMAGDSVRLAMESSGAHFDGTLEHSKLVGTFFQTGGKWPLTLTRVRAKSGKSAHDSGSGQH